MTAAEYVVRFLAAQGVSHVFELSGGMITPLLDAAARNGAPTLVSMRHEQAAGFAAEGMARVTGVPGVAFATSGPGATNLLTAVASCYFDSTPAVFITGQVNRSELTISNGRRQTGFQETDIVSIARPITKAVWRVNDPTQLGETLAAAFRIATSDRPGPVLLDIPMDVQRAECNERIAKIEPDRSEALPLPVAEVLLILRSAKRPLVLVGGGCANARSEVYALLKHLWIPVVHSLMAVDMLTSDHPLRVGMIGSYGNRWANKALSEADAILVLGSRLDVRQTGSNVDSFTKGKQIIRVDVDPREDRVPASLRINATLRDFARAMISPGSSPVNGAGIRALTERHAQIASWREAWPDETESNAPAGTVNPNSFMRAFGKASAEHVSAYVVDVGAHQMWAVQSLPLYGARFITSGGLGAMGFALPAAIGVALATRKPVVVIVGDGGMQVNIQELQTIAELRLPIKIVVLNNRGHGMVRQFQRAYCEGREVSTNPSAPNFALVAKAFGIDSASYPAANTLDEALSWLWESPSAPFLLEVEIDPATHALPKLAFGSPVGEMEPRVDFPGRHL